MNNITLHGRLTKDPEVKTTQSGVTVCNISVAVDRRHQSGETKQTDFFDCSAWRGAAEVISKYFTKGKEILLSGEMQSRKYTDKSGVNRTAWNVQIESFDFCGSKSDSGNQAAPRVAGAPVTVAADVHFDELPGDEQGLPF